MAREYSFYAFSRETWQGQCGGCTEEDIAAIQSKLAELDDYPGKFTTEELAAILHGNSRPSNDDPEPSCASWLALELLTIGQIPEPSPSASRFWYALSQQFAIDSAPNVDGIALTPNSQAKRIGRYLQRGRPLFGDGFPSPHFVYGWLAADDLQALLEITESDAWDAYSAPHRYKPKAKVSFDRERGAAIEWLRSCEAARRDVFFSAVSFGATPLA